MRDANRRLASFAVLIATAEALQCGRLASLRARPARSCHAVLLAEPTSPVERAAEKVRTAAAAFGEAQLQSADVWLERALTSQDASALDSTLLWLDERTLVEECPVGSKSDDEKCAALEAALEGLRSQLAVKTNYEGAFCEQDPCVAPWGRAAAPNSFTNSLPENLRPTYKTSLDEAADKVVSAAAAFGEIHGESARAWVGECMSGRSADSQSLLERRVALFDACLVDANKAGAASSGAGSSCAALEEALSEMIDVLEGQLPPEEVLSSSEDVPEHVPEVGPEAAVPEHVPEAAKAAMVTAAPPTGYEWGMSF